jgi:hypothetical protein
MTEDINFYFTYNRVTGDIRSLSTGLPPANLDLTESFVKVTDEYLNLFHDFMNTKKKFTSYKIDTTRSTLKVIDKFAIELDSDYNSFYKISIIRADAANSVDALIKIKSINDIPYLIFKFNQAKQELSNKKESHAIIYATKKRDINVLYQSFKFNFDDIDDNNEIAIIINQIDLDLLFKNEFSFYTRKIFKTYGYTIE